MGTALPKLGVGSGMAHGGGDYGQSPPDVISIGPPRNPPFGGRTAKVPMPSPVTQALAAPAKANVPVPAPTGAPVTLAPSAPPAPQMNPYTGKPLAANEYVGPAGSEAEHPGMVRIPPPGWWDPANPNYERRNYVIGADGKIVAREPGYFDPAHPADTGRTNERNREWDTRVQSVRYSEPGIPQWGPGQEKPDLSKLPVPAAGTSGGVTRMQKIGPALLGGLLSGTESAVSLPPSLIGAEPSSAADVNVPSDPTQALLQALMQLIAKSRSRPSGVSEA